MFDTHWNRKVRGLPALGWIILRTVFQRLHDRISTFLHSSNFAQCGAGSIIRSNFFCRYPGRIKVGSNVEIGRNVTFTFTNTKQNIINPLQSVIGDGTIIGSRSILDFSGGIIIGENCTISDNIYIETHNHGLNPRAEPDIRQLSIGREVWIGTGVIILPSVHSIGKGSIIGAMSVVTKDVPPHVIVAGNPAKIIRELSGNEKKI